MSERIPSGKDWTFCDKCRGDGFAIDTESWEPEDCRACDGEGFITKEVAMQREAFDQQMRQILADALVKATQ
jgi:DnaJ-class molecular chaperone